MADQVVQALIAKGWQLLEPIPKEQWYISEHDGVVITQFQDIAECQSDDISAFVAEAPALVTALLQALEKLLSQATETR